MPKQKPRTTPRGFFFATAEGAIKKPGRRDLGMIAADRPSTVAGTFTTNRVQAAPVRICRERIDSGKGQVFLVNSGNANACTGVRGRRDAERMVSHLAEALGLPERSIYPCSTGVIGTPMPMDRILPAIGRLASGLGKSFLDDVAQAIMTTDTFPKMASRTVRINGEDGVIAGICKGAGMIAPKMATMLCFLITDISVEKTGLRSALQAAVNKSFNRITIDGDMSTNDTALIMANGALGNRPLTAGSAGMRAFQKELDDLAYELALLIVKDGEGATKLVEVAVRGAKSERDAEQAALTVANSSLVKTAIYGNDANWGRIMAALGRSGISFNPEKTDISFNRVKVVKRGVMNNRDQEATAEMKKKELRITIDLHAGQHEARVLTCDLTEDYIRINAEYRT